jgi:hypothetical protein
VSARHTPSSQAPIPLLRPDDTPGTCVSLTSNERNSLSLPTPWIFCALRTSAGITGYSEFGNGKLARGLPGLVRNIAGGLFGEAAARRNAFHG